MIKYILILLLIPSVCFSQSKGTKLIGNNLWLVTYDQTGLATDSVRIGAETNATVLQAIGFTPASITALDAKQNIITTRGAVTQATNKTTAVTLNELSGKITMSNAALAAAAEVSFTVNNSLVTTNDVPVVAVQATGTAGAYLVSVGSVANGSFTITVSNASAGSLSQAIILNFIIIKG